MELLDWEKKKINFTISLEEIEETCGKLSKYEKWGGRNSLKALDTWGFCAGGVVADEKAKIVLGERKFKEYKKLGVFESKDKAKSAFGNDEDGKYRFKKYQEVGLFDTSDEKMLRKIVGERELEDYNEELGNIDYGLKEDIKSARDDYDKEFNRLNKKFFKRDNPETVGGSLRFGVMNNINHQIMKQMDVKEEEKKETKVEIVKKYKLNFKALPSKFNLNLPELT